ncbi:MAG TPA: hypothetical protein VFV34_21765 [Blastocatellia bacterium]|nr:hypothetical protein [Blastocatellia bacterium]
MMAAIALFFLLLTGFHQESPGPKTVPLDTEFTLKSGEEAIVDGTVIRIRFASVVSDSRCPENVTCVWAGNAEVNLELRKKKKPVNPVIVNTTLAPRQAEFKGLVVKLVGLKPQPAGGTPIDQGRYEATLIVSRAKD